MVHTVRCVELITEGDALAAMRRIGVDPAGVGIMTPKHFHYNVLVKGLAPTQANVIKQEMLSIGAEAAVARGTVSCKIATTDALLSGTLKHFTMLVDKLNGQSFGLSSVAALVKEAIDNTCKIRLMLKGRTKSWDIGGRTLVMGILNVTPDSFSDGGACFDNASAVERALEMAEEGADIIDVGGESTRPGATPVPVGEEMRRVVPVVEALAKAGLAVSIDTGKAAVAEAALKAGAEMVNDVSAFKDPLMAAVCKEYGCAAVLMHMRGTPTDMQSNVDYADIISEIYDYLFTRTQYALGAGLSPESLIIDPGLGFGKSRDGNFEIIRRLKEFTSMGFPVMVGPSRKSFITKTLGDAADGAMNGTLSVAAISAMNGAHIVRVHDVRETVMAVRIADEVRRGEGA